MSGKNLGLTPLSSRKRLLIAESELNRAQLVGDMAVITASFHTLTERAKSFRFIASSAAGVLVGLTAIRRNKSAEAKVKPSWLQVVLKAARLVTTFWVASSPRRDQNSE